MKFLKYGAFSILALSLSGFTWLAWFLVTAPAASFDTQGPGLLGAFVMFASQVSGVAGIVLLGAWKAISIWRGSQHQDG